MIVDTGTGSPAIQRMLMVRNVMTSGVRMLPINVNQRYMLVSQETSGYNKDNHRDIKNSFISIQEVLLYIMHVVFLSIECISSLPAGIMLITAQCLGHR